MAHSKPKKAAPASKRSRTDAILKRVGVLQRQVDRQMVALDASMKAYEPTFLRMKAALH